MKFVCPVCGYVEEIDGDELPADYKCPVCKCPGEKFNKMDAARSSTRWTASSPGQPST